MNKSNRPETIVKKIVNPYGRTFLLSLTMLVLAAGCTWPWVFSTGKGPQHPDPLEGWKIAFNQEPSQMIVKDYQDYIQKLSPKERERAGPIQYFEDGTGQHAILIWIGINEKVWRHILIYDNDGKRIKTIKYVSGDYHS